MNNIMIRASSAIALLLLTLRRSVCFTSPTGPSILSSSSTAARRRLCGKDDGYSNRLAHRNSPTTNDIGSTYYRASPLRLRNNDDDDDESDYVGGAAIGGDLATALARLDEEWRLATNRDGGRKRIGDWTVLDVGDGGSGDDEFGSGESSSPFSSSSSSPPSSSSEIVYLLEPASGAMPSCIIFFLGGAVLGQFPHISYSAFCKKLASKLNASIVAVPYVVGLDHFDIARRAVKRMKNAVIICEDVNGRGYPSSLPKFAIGHSLGAKLHSIGIAATGIGEELSGVGFVSYNNFGFAETITMARSFVREMRVKGGMGSSSSSTPFDALFDLAGMAVSAVGLEFTPSPNDMDKILKSKFDGDVLKKIRMFCFDDDDLDSTERFLDCFVGGGAVRPSVSYLPGTHLTPVFLKFGLDDLPNDARDMANQFTGGFQNASFGNEDMLDTLVDEVSGWMLGKGPSYNRAAPKQIAGVIDAEIEG
ncbi:hypothetical protein ACHAXA_008648 [Cyclostephanos tholiformis]|uniref:Uncharacterized protein n=1 Tax=Cyclostephanos tholiformis TaxID=382380 RepID=A0ABD3RBB8_9STRA